MKFQLAHAVAFCLMTLAAGAQTSSSGTDKMPWQQTGDAQASKAGDAVQLLDPVRVSVPAGKLTVVPLHFVIANGLHINSHTPHDANLIPTRIAVVDGNGLRTQTVDFPPGTDTTFSFAPHEKLSVYTGDFVLKAHIIAARGTHQWQGVVRYQACNMDECMPPRKLPVAVDIVAN
jgi:hypothetical protein